MQGNQYYRHTQVSALWFLVAPLAWRCLAVASYGRGGELTNYGHVIIIIIITIQVRRAIQQLRSVYVIDGMCLYTRMYI